MAKQRKRVSLSASQQSHHTQKLLSKQKRNKELQQNKKNSDVSEEKPDIAYPDEKLWTKWKDVFLCGTEFANMESVHSKPWNFNNLKQYIRDPSLFKQHMDAGEDKISKICLYGATEVQALPSNGNVIMVPYILAVVGDVDLPRMVGVTSVQRVGESIVPMEDFRLTWVRMNMDVGRRRSSTKKDEPEIYFMDCYKRQQVVKHMKEEDVVEFNYVIPYIVAPQVAMKDEEPPTNINERIEFNGKGVQLTYDWEMDQLKPYVQELCEEYGFDFAEKGKELRDIILAEKKKVLDQFEQEQQQRKGTFTSLPEDEQKSLKAVKFIKFYPQNPEIQGFKNPIVNRYYGKAHVVL